MNRNCMLFLTRIDVKAKDSISKTLRVIKLGRPMFAVISTTNVAMSPIKRSG
jgi:hypothetical protein